MYSTGTYSTVLTSVSLLPPSLSPPLVLPQCQGKRKWKMNEHGRMCLLQFLFVPESPVADVQMVQMWSILPPSTRSCELAACMQCVLPIVRTVEPQTMDTLIMQHYVGRLSNSPYTHYYSGSSDPQRKGQAL